MRTATCATISWNSSRRLYSRSAGKIISAHPEYIEANFMVALPLPDLPPEISALRILALDLRWTWSHEADALWERVDARLWRRTRNPWSVLQSASARRLQRLAADTAETAASHASSARVAGERRAREALFAGQQRSAQQPCRPRHNGKALWRRKRGTTDARDRARRRRLARRRGTPSGYRDLPHQRRPCGIRHHRAGASFRRQAEADLLPGAVAD